MTDNRKEQWQVLGLSLEASLANATNDDILAHAAERARRELTQLYDLPHTASLGEVIAAGTEREAFAQQVSGTNETRIGAALDRILGDPSRGNGVKVAEKSTGPIQRS